MARKPKSWQERLRNSKGLPKVVKVPVKMVCKWGTKNVSDTMLIPAPNEVNDIMNEDA